MTGYLIFFLKVFSFIIRGKEEREIDGWKRWGYPDWEGEKVSFHFVNYEISPKSNRKNQGSPSFDKSAINFQFKKKSNPTKKSKVTKKKTTNPDIQDLIESHYN